MSRQVTEYTLVSEKIQRPMTLSIVTDLHNGSYADDLPRMARTDAILIVGDLVDRHRNTFDQAVRFLADAPKVAPTFYAIGNHERKFKQRAFYWPLVEKSRVTILDNRYTRFGGLVLGGLSSAPPGQAQADFLANMAREPGFRLLMCHHPEYFKKYVLPYEIDLTVSGHAHGGQVQIAGHGLYAPGQGFFPSWTHGFYFDRRLLVSRGMTNASRAPRLNNPCELLLLHLEGR